MKTNAKLLVLLLFPIILIPCVEANAYLNENFTWETDLVNVTWASLVFGDINSDGYKDLAFTGCSGASASVCNSYEAKVYINNGTSLVENSTWQQNLTGVNRGSSVLGDIDNDGDLDLISTGCNSGGGAGACGGYNAFVYINNGTSLLENSTWQSDITGIFYGSIALGDLDNDGKLDLALTGQSSTANIAKIYINNGSGFAENITWQSDLTGVYMSSIALGDLDNDGDLDLVLTGSSSLNAKIYINNGTSLARNTTWDTNLLAVEDSSVTLGDIDNNGDLDLSLIGHTTGDRHRIYNNTGSTFEQIQQDAQSGGILAGIFDGSQAFGDYDNDGDLDLITTGYEYFTTLYLYNESSGLFTEYTTDPESGIKDLGMGSTVVWSDLDNDNDLDLMLTGVYHPTFGNQVLIYINNITTANTAPNASTDFNASYLNNQLTLQWGNASDTETTALGLYYNLKVGNSSHKHSIVSGVYGGGDDNGYFGNMMQRRSITLKNLNIQPNQTIYWSVQTIDTGLKAGNWSVEQNYTLPLDITQPVITLNAPFDQFNTTNQIITFNATVSDNANLTNVSLYGNWSGWHLNETNSSGIINNTYYIFTKDLTAYGDGSYQWLFEAYDATNNSINSSARTFRIDTTYPIINLVTPTNASSWTSSQTVTFTYNVTDLAILNCSLIIDNAVDQTDTSVAVNTAQTFSKTLSNGDYNWSINCTDTVDYENASETRTLTVSYTAPSSNGGGGGGGAGGTATSETKSTGTIEAGEIKTISFTKNFGITEIVVTAESQISGTIKVEDITSSPGIAARAIAPEEGAVYKYLSITAAEVSAAMEKAVVKFKVTKNWITYNKFDENKVELKRLVGAAWESLPTKKASSDKDYFYYEAETAGFSKFAIVGKKEVEITKVEVKEEVKVEENVTEEAMGEDNVTEEMKMVEEVRRFEWKESYLWIVSVVAGLIVISFLVVYWLRRR